MDTMRAAWVAAGFAVAIAFPASADEVTVTMHALTPTGVGQEIGTIHAVDRDGGLRIEPRLSKLSPGRHGFHVHTNPDCGATGPDGKTGPGLAAGGHLDPKDTNKHEGPTGDGHLGDLPVLVVGEDGMTREPVFAPRISVEAVRGHAIMIHAGGDNYADQPQALGGGGARVACGVIPKG